MHTHIHAIMIKRGSKEGGTKGVRPLRAPPQIKRENSEKFVSLCTWFPDARKSLLTPLINHEGVMGAEITNFLVSSNADYGKKIK